MNRQSKKHSSPKLWLIAGGVAAVLIFAAVMILVNRGAPKSEDWVPVIPGNTTASDTGESIAAGEDPTPSDPEDHSDSSPTETGQTSSTEGAQGNTVPTVTPGDEDPYENHLAAAMVIGISMQYPDFEFLGIYTASHTPVSAHDSSLGAYVVFKSGGETLALKSTPLPGERGDKGTADLYVPAIGYATYELIDPNSIPLAGLNVLQIEDLEELIIASSQVSIIER